MKKKVIYALGVFDGVHLGHQALLKACRELADSLGCQAGVVTFSSHPDGLVLGKAPNLINTAPDRERLLRSFGADCVIELPFDEHMMHMPWQDFYRLLAEQYQAAGFVCGEDFRFGDRGAGNATLLQKLSEEQNLPCRVIPKQKIGDITVSSTYIRRLLEMGEMAEAVRFLGHPHILTGKVVAGQKLGRTIGIPTANLSLPEGLAQPKKGVYACKAAIDGKSYLAVTNVGNRPTVAGENLTVESWILDFDGDLYGKEITLSFYDFLREEKKFPDLQTLQAQIQEDSRKVRKIFQNQ